MKLFSLYEGILEGFSKGSEVSSEPLRQRRDAWGNYHAAGKRAFAGNIRREFVDIGGKRVDTVMFTKYQDALLEESGGHEIALSVVGSGRKQVVAMRTPKGVFKASFPAIAVGAIRSVIVIWVAAGILILLATLSIGQIAVWILPHFLAQLVWYGLWAGFVFLLILPFYLGFRHYKAWRAIPAAAS